MTKKVSKKAATKKVSVATVDSKDVSNELLDRIAKLEKKQAVLVKGLKWAGGEIKGLFGASIIGSYLLEIADKIEKADG